MRLNILSISFILASACWAQEQPAPDTLLLQQQVNEFAILLETHTAQIDEAAEIDSIHGLASEIQERSAFLLEEVRKAYPIDETILFDRELINATQLDMEPALALEYQQRAHAAQEHIDAVMPDYYKALRKINEISTRMQGIRRTEKAQRSNQDLKEIDLLVRDVEE